MVLTHLHHDHADGLADFQGADIIVSDENYQTSKGVRGAALGAVPSRWPGWFSPRRVTLTGAAPCPASARLFPLTGDGTVFAVPTSRTMPGHLSVVVRANEMTDFLAGDATYDETLLKQRIADGATADPAASVSTLEAIAMFARSEPRRCCCRRVTRWPSCAFGTASPCPTHSRRWERTREGRYPSSSRHGRVPPRKRQMRNASPWPGKSRRTPGRIPAAGGREDMPCGRGRRWPAGGIQPRIDRRVPLRGLAISRGVSGARRCASRAS